MKPASASPRSVHAAVESLGGVATRQQLIACGFSGTDLTRGVRLGTIQRIRQARYVTMAASADAVAAARVGGMLAGPSAAESYGLWAGFDKRLHVSVGQNSSRLRTNRMPSALDAGHRLTPDIKDREIVVHWLKHGAVPELGPECWRVSMPVCLRQMVDWADQETAMACVETALSRMSKAALLLDFADAPALHRLMVERAQGGCDSGWESIVANRLRGRGLRVIHQVAIEGLGDFDLGIVGTAVIVEIDGFAYHRDAVAFENDRRRRTELAARGYVVVVLTARQLATDWRWCERMILTAVARATR